MKIIKLTKTGKVTKKAWSADSLEDAVDKATGFARLMGGNYGIVDGDKALAQVHATTMEKQFYNTECRYL